MKKAAQDGTESLTFLKVLLAPTVKLHLPAGNLALKNIRFFVADSAHGIETLGFLIGSPVLQPLRVDTRTVLGERRKELNDTDCNNEPSFLSINDIAERILMTEVAKKETPTSMLRDLK